MDYIKSSLIILTTLFIGSLLKDILGLPIPETIYALLIFFALLLFKIINFETVAESCEFILTFMAMYFIPPATGLIESYHLISDKMIPIIFIVIISTILTFITTGLTVKFIIRRRDE
ncbi:MAG: CidA/LrgA family protein [Tissierellia bacterium]|nr:CidA/LrgA family protein [Tissierellia bacterium]